MNTDIRKIKMRDCRGGFITLVSVLVVGAVGVLISLSLIVFGLGSSRTAFSVSRSAAARAYADSCAETALERIRESVPFTGTGGIAFGDGGCSYSVLSLGGQNRLVHATGTAGNSVRRVDISVVGILPRIKLLSWLEAPN